MSCPVCAAHTPCKNKKCRGGVVPWDKVDTKHIIEEETEPTKEELIYTVRKPARKLQIGQTPQTTREACTLQFRITKWRVKSRQEDAKLGVNEDVDTKAIIKPHIDNRNKVMGTSIARPINKHDPSGARIGRNAVAEGILKIFCEHKYYGDVYADCGVLHSGSFRRKETIDSYLPLKAMKPNEEITIGDIASIVPFKEPTCVIEVTESMLWKLLQMSLYKLKKKPDGAAGFLQVAGINYKWDKHSYKLLHVDVRSREDGKFVPIALNGPKGGRKFNMATSMFIADCIDNPEWNDQDAEGKIKPYKFRAFGEGYGKVLGKAKGVSWKENDSVYKIVVQHFEDAKKRSGGILLPVFMPMEKPTHPRPGLVRNFTAPIPNPIPEKQDEKQNDGTCRSPRKDEHAIPVSGPPPRTKVNKPSTRGASANA